MMDKRKKCCATCDFLYDGEKYLTDIADQDPENTYIKPCPGLSSTGQLYEIVRLNLAVVSKESAISKLMDEAAKEGREITREEAINAIRQFDAPDESEPKECEEWAARGEYYSGPTSREEEQKRFYEYVAAYGEAGVRVRKKYPIDDTIREMLWQEALKAQKRALFLSQGYMRANKKRA